MDFKCITWNVNKFKKNKVEHVLVKQKYELICLQETQKNIKEC